MLKGVRERFTYANVMATMALFVALGLGSAWAATELNRNSVGVQEIKKNAVRASEIAKNAVRGPEVKKDALRGRDVLEATLGQVPSAQNAATAENATAAQTAQSAQTAEDAALLDGLNSDDFLGADAAAGGALSGNYPNPTIAPDAVDGASVAPDSLGGGDIDESSLGTVPAADSVDGNNFRDIGYAALNSATGFLSLINNLGGLTVQASCNAGPDLNLQATTSTNNAYLRVTRVSGAAAGTNFDTDFDTTDPPITLANNDEAGNYSLTYLSAPAGVGGNEVFASFTAEESNNIAGSATDCFVRGRVISNVP